MKKVIVAIFVMFTVVANATTPIATTQEQAHKIGYGWVVKQIREIEKSQGPQECVIFRGRVFPGGFLAVQGRHPKANHMSICKHSVVVD